MKKVMVISLVLIVALSCEKIPFDYRNKYVGNYEVTETLHYSIGATSPDSTLDSTYIEVYNGKVGYDGDEDIIIQYGDNKEFFGRLITPPNSFLISPAPKNLTDLYIGAIFSEDNSRFEIKYTLRIDPPLNHTGQWFGWKNITIKGKKYN